LSENIQPQEYMLDFLGRMRFYGIYEGIVVSIADPLKQNRIQLRVPITGSEVTNWARACLPPMSKADHPDHVEHTASAVAALLTTSSTSASGTAASAGSPAHTHSVSVTVPALTVVAKSGAGTLRHPHKTVANTSEKWNDSIDIVKTEEHTPHRILPKVGDRVWVMFISGIPEEPVWIGVQ